MGYQAAAATITLTTDGRIVDMLVDYDLKVVMVWIGGEYVGTWKNHTAARQELGLIDVPAKGRK